MKSILFEGSSLLRLTPFHHIQTDRAALKPQLGFLQVTGGHLRQTLIQLEKHERIYGEYPRSLDLMKSRLAALLFPSA